MLLPLMLLLQYIDSDFHHDSFVTFGKDVCDYRSCWMVDVGYLGGNW